MDHSRLTAGKLLRALRLRAGLSQGRLARAAGMDPSQVAYYERDRVAFGRTIESRPAILALAAALVAHGIPRREAWKWVLDTGYAPDDAAEANSRPALREDFGPDLGDALMEACTRPAQEQRDLVGVLRRGIEACDRVDELVGAWS